MSPFAVNYIIYDYIIVLICWHYINKMYLNVYKYSQLMKMSYCTDIVMFTKILLGNYIYMRFSCTV